MCRPSSQEKQGQALPPSMQWERKGPCVCCRSHGSHRGSLFPASRRFSFSFSWSRYPFDRWACLTGPGRHQIQLFFCPSSFVFFMLSRLGPLRSFGSSVRLFSPSASPKKNRAAKRAVIPSSQPEQVAAPVFFCVGLTPVGETMLHQRNESR